MSVSSPEPLLTVRMKHQVGSLPLEVSFTLTAPWTVLFGPSGSGKTTVLRAIAGFVSPDDGRIVAGPNQMTLVDTKARIFLAPHQRPVRSSGQGAKLFPHMTVQENVSYGVGLSSQLKDGHELVEEVLELFRLDTFAERKPHDLSGGERQKVLVARAAASAVENNHLLLLDEPFHGLDLRVRDELLEQLRQWLNRGKTPVLSVTHDVGEAFQLEAEVIKVAEGRVVEQGPVATVLASERARLMQQLAKG